MNNLNILTRISQQYENKSTELTERCRISFPYDVTSLFKYCVRSKMIVLFVYVRVLMVGSGS